MGRDEEGKTRSLIVRSHCNADGVLIVDPAVEKECRLLCSQEGFDPDKKVWITENYKQGNYELDYNTIYMRAWQMYVEEVETKLLSPATLGAQNTLPSYAFDPWFSLEGDFNVKSTSK